MLAATLSLAASRPAAAEPGSPGFGGRPFGGRVESAAGLVQQSLPCLRSILERSLYGASDREAAAWLVAPAAPGGEVTCIAWPSSDGKGEARWSGPLPAGVLAQVHSHPVRSGTGQTWTRRPSSADCEVARRLGIPVLAVTPGSVYECRPADGAIVPLLRAGWDRATPSELPALPASAETRLAGFRAPAATLPP